MGQVIFITENNKFAFLANTLSGLEVASIIMDLNILLKYG